MTVLASNDDMEQRLPEGAVVAGVEVVSEIERGGMAVVYRGRRVRDGHPVALKVGTAEATRHRTEERFKNEARLGHALQHPNIVRPLQVGALDGPDGFEGRMYLVTELVEGRTLSWLMTYHRQGVPADRAVSLAMQVAEAMVVMHEQAIIHRDLTPSNIIVDDDDRVHVIDFGLAYALGSDDVERSEDLTMDGAAPGTALYMSPQQAMHLEPCPAFDVYSFGVILYELLSGAAPNSGLPPEEVVAYRCNPKSKLFPLRRVAPAAPAELVELVEQCLAYDADERPSAAEIVRCLQGVAEAACNPQPRESSEPTKLMRRPVVVAEGARPAGDNTLVKLVRDNVELPAAHRVRELADEFAGRGPGGGADERRLIPLVDAKAAATLAKEEHERDALPDKEFPIVSGEAVQEDESRRGRGLLVAVAAALFVASAAAVAWWPRPAGEASTNTVIGAGAELSGPEPEPEPEPEPGPELKPEPDSKVSPAPEVSEVEPSPTGSGEPEVEIQPGAKARKPKARGKKPNPPKPRKAEPGPLTPCAAQRVEAREANEGKRWKAVLASTKDASCWSSKTKRALLRTRALMKLKRYDACMVESAGHDEPQLQRMNRECYRRAIEN